MHMVHLLSEYHVASTKYSWLQMITIIIIFYYTYKVSLCWRSKCVNDKVGKQNRWYSAFNLQSI